MSSLSDLTEPEYKAAKDSLIAAVAAGGSGASGRSVYTTITNEDSYVVPATNPLYAVALEARASNTSQKRVFDFDGSDLPSSTHSNVAVDSPSGTLSPSYDGSSTAAGTIHQYIKWGNNSETAKFYYGNIEPASTEQGYSFSGHPTSMGSVSVSSSSIYLLNTSTSIPIDYTRCQTVIGFSGTANIKVWRSSDFSANKIWVTEKTMWWGSPGAEKIYEVQLVNESGSIFAQTPVLVQDISGVMAALYTLYPSATIGTQVSRFWSAMNYILEATSDLLLFVNREQGVSEQSRLRALVVNRSTGAYKWFYDNDVSNSSLTNFFLRNGTVHYWTFDSIDNFNYYGRGWTSAINTVSIDDWSETIVPGSDDVSHSPLIYRHMTSGVINIGADRFIPSGYAKRLFNFSTGLWSSDSTLYLYVDYSVLKYIHYNISVSDTFWDNNEWSWDANLFTSQSAPSLYYGGLLPSYTNGGYVERVINTVDAVSIDGPLVVSGTGLSSITYSITQVGITNQALTYEPTAAQKAAIVALDSITFRIDISMADTTSPPKLDYIKIPVTVKDRYVTSDFLTTAINSNSVSVANSGLTNRSIMIAIIEA